MGWVKKLSLASPKSPFRAFVDLLCFSLRIRPKFHGEKASHVFQNEFLGLQQAAPRRESGTKAILKDLEANEKHLETFSSDSRNPTGTRDWTRNQPTDVAAPPAAGNCRDRSFKSSSTTGFTFCVMEGTQNWLRSSFTPRTLSTVKPRGRAEPELSPTPDLQACY